MLVIAQPFNDVGYFPVLIFLKWMIGKKLFGDKKDLESETGNKLSRKNFLLHVHSTA